ncbi:hypothetical protein AQUCO_01400904v1 [Aquilegia coerulea]|uniref:RING-type domain-containing protein n=1 Tax=Aquilegia coerulea TaxID=218851 RepID=A0A2G5DYU4_AQUCA|nr:hypothetical protein AQUCO_01400904v1 [Aquilegia coerulea]
MENVKEGCGGAKSSSNEENPNNNNNNNSSISNNNSSDSLQPISRTPFTNLGQVDADLALARTLQEQERAYMMLRMSGGEGSSDFGSSEAGSFLQEEEEEDDCYDDDDDDLNDDDDAIGTDADEDAFDIHQNLEDEDAIASPAEVEIDPSAFVNDDEAFARALQDAEERELAARLMALTGGTDWTAEDTENDNNSQDTWEEVDPDELSYEELLALGEVVGTESRGLSADTIASLPSINYKAQSNQDGSAEQCVICRLEYEDEDTLTVLSCKHSYHSECINNWLQINKVCPVCSAEVSTSTNL